MIDNDKVEKYLDDLKSVDDNKFEIIESLRKIIFKIASEPEEKIMYGGLVYVSDRMFVGLFPRKDYITIEFDKGTGMKDSKGVLQGEGKGRRHITVQNQKDVKDKDVASYIKQSFELKK